MAQESNPEFKSAVLAEALANQDMAAVAFALRHEPVVVPLQVPAEADDPSGGEVWMFRQPDTARQALLLFSDAANKPDALPPFVGLRDGLWLHTFLRTFGDDIETVFFDLAGPHPMQASPSEILRVLDL